MFLLMGKGAKGGLDWDGGSAIYGFVLFVWGKISTETLPCLLLQLQFLLLFLLILFHFF